MQKALLTAALLTTMTLGIAAPYSPAMTGNVYVDFLYHAEPMSPSESEKREKAYSYFEGVKDATEGTVWCATVELPTPDTAYEIAHEIKAMKKNDRAKNASTFIRDYLKRKFPCSTMKRR